MRILQSEFAARLATGAATTCLCWRLTRADGRVIGVTEHDRVIVVDGVQFEPNGAVDTAVLTTSSSLKPGQGGGTGALSSDAMTEADLRAGLWNGARVDVLRVDWQRPDLFVVIWSGRLSEITQTGEAFTADLVSLKADLERPVGRLYARACDAVLGDARCGASAAGRTCDQRFATCRDVFGNTANFRGFPHMPGTDFVLAGPNANKSKRS